MGTEWEYHQDGRDRATGLGCAGIACVAFLAACAVLLSIASCAADRAKADIVAGGNAVEVVRTPSEESRTRDEWEAGEWSVTVQDLRREHEPGAAHALNGKNAALVTDTTYGKGAGMVDLVTFDATTNVMIRHYGQLEPDGRVRWYAAETVLDEDGKPVVMPRN